MKKVLVYGCAEFGQVVRNLVKNCGHEFVGFIDDYNDGKDVLGNYEQVKENFPPKVIYHPDSAYYIVIGVGYKSLRDRWSIYQRALLDGYRLVSLIHPQAIVDKTAKIGEGVIVMAGAVVDYKAEIKDLAVLWNGVVVSHDSVVGENTFLSPNSTICGGVSIGRDCFIGAGAVVTDHKKVFDDGFVKAGGVNAHKRIV